MMSSMAGVDSPYKGLVPYSEEDAQFFFGREAEREIIEANLIASRLTLLYGASGVGKSSVLRAGVASHLKTLTAQSLREQDKPEFIVVVFNSWRDEPIDGLLACVQDEVNIIFKEQSIAIPPQSSLTATLYTWTQAIDCDLLIILDQFEEYFLYHTSAENNAFDTEFPRTVNRIELRTNFLISIREDSLAKLDRFKGRIPFLFDDYLRLEYLDLNAAREAIEKPIEQYNLLHPQNSPIRIEPALTDAILQQVQTGELLLGEVGRGVVKENISKMQIETPYLQLVMTRLWDEELLLNSQVLRLETLNRLGGAQSIVRTHLDRVMQDFSEADQKTAALFFEYLVTPSGTKIAYPVPDLISYSGRSEKEVESILTTLEKERVLRHIPPTIGQVDVVRYEIYHDVLARSILDWRSRKAEEERYKSSARKAAKIINLLGIMLIIVFIALVVSVEANGGRFLGHCILWHRRCG